MDIEWSTNYTSIFFYIFIISGQADSEEKINQKFQKQTTSHIFYWKLRLKFAVLLLNIIKSNEILSYDIYTLRN